MSPPSESGWVVIALTNSMVEVMLYDFQGYAIKDCVAFTQFSGDAHIMESSQYERNLATLTTSLDPDDSPLKCVSLHLPSF